MTAADVEDVAPAARNPALDGVRGIAILLVVIYHFYVFAPITRDVGDNRPSLDAAVMRVMETGWMGVDLFFVLSGFLITGILLEAKGHTGYVRNFYARRVLRIFPVYYGFLFVLIVLLPLIPHFAGNDDLAELRHYQGWYWSYLLNFWMSFDPGTQGGDFRNAHLWSLSVEEQFYLVWPAIVLLLNRRRLVACAIAAFAGAIVFRIIIRWLVNEEAAYFLTPSRMDAFAAGALVALIPAADLHRFARYAMPAAAAAAAALAVMFVAMRGLHPYDLPVQIFGFSCIAVMFGALLLLVRSSGRRASANAWLSSRPLTFFGKYSYAMYVVHIQLVVAANAVLIDADLRPPTLAGFEVPGRLLYSAGLTAATAAVAFASWHLYERHFLKLKDRFRRSPLDESASSAQTLAPD